MPGDPLDDRLLAVLLAAPALSREGVSLPWLARRLDVRASVVMRRAAWLGEAPIGAMPGRGWLRVIPEGDQWRLALTEAGRREAQRRAGPADRDGHDRVSPAD